MSTKKKLTITIASLCVAVLAVVGITVGVLAAKNATVTNPINVGYTATEVSAKVSATYKLANDTEATAMTTSDGKTEIEFNGEEADTTATGSLTASDISLASNNKSVVFTYTIENTGDEDFTATLTIPTTKVNVNIAYALDGTETDSLTFTVKGTKNNNTENTKRVFTVTVSIDSVAKNASFSGDFAWTLVNVNANQD
jgi:hypothetical protein